MEHNFTWKNDGRTKVMIGCGTRPEIIRLAAVIKRCREYFDCCVVYYNQNWDRNLSAVFWEDFELKNDAGEFGPDILVAPVLYAGQREREVYLPAGSAWQDAHSGQRYQGGQRLWAPAPLEYIPLFVREGARLGFSLE